jgi:signal transduction histidine kinase
LDESLRLQQRLRDLTHQSLSEQEDERGTISRGLHNEIAQTLLGINVRLLTLKKETAVNTKGLKQEIANTLRLVEKSAKTMLNFADELGQRHGP